MFFTHRETCIILRLDVPAKSHEQCVVRFGAVFNAAKQTKRRVLLDALVKLHDIQIFYRDPAEYGSVTRKTNALLSSSIDRTT
jgi:hypothetical protein